MRLSGVGLLLRYHHLRRTVDLGELRLYIQPYYSSSAAEVRVIFPVAEGVMWYTIVCLRQVDSGGRSEFLFFKLSRQVVMSQIPNPISGH